MVETSRKMPRMVWVGALLLGAILGLTLFVSAVTLQQHRQPLPILGAVADFTLTNQDGQVATLDSITNHVWVADIIFTRCAGPCPRMTGQMASLQNTLPPASQAKLVTMTTDPDFDSPAVLKKYGEHFKADFNRWTFLTGTKGEIAGLAGGSLKLSAVPVDPAERTNNADLFIHTTIFVLVDRHAQLRGVFETGGDDVDWTNAVQPKLLAAISQLENEP
jgi:cytochrome oxidase Cu insertion factor (SCO1/SenC/PrrC family)